MVAHRWVGVSCGSLVGGLGDTLPYAKMLTDCEVLGDGVRGVLSHLRVGGLFGTKEIVCGSCRSFVCVCWCVVHWLFVGRSFIGSLVVHWSVFVGCSLVHGLVGYRLFIH